jgi:hypothetical protein
MSPEWQHPSSRFLRERMGILAAFYWKGAKPGLYDSITPVNFFPTIFNEQFDAHLPLSQDTSYFSDYNRPYRFVDVTETVRPRSGK